MRFVEKHCYVPEGALVGQPLRLIDSQEAFYYALFDNPAGTRKAILSVGRKNAKTATIATVVIVFLVGPEAKQNSQIVSGALSREQAGLVYNLASKIIAFSPTLAPLVRNVPSTKRLIGLPMNVEYKALSAEGKTTHGLSPIVAILDEMGQVKGPQSDFIDAVTTSQGAHENPILIVISTQAPTDADWLSLEIDDCVQNKPPKFVCHLYSADQNADVSDTDAWNAANPALGKFLQLQEVVDQAEKAARMPSFENTFRNLVLNQRVSTVTPFISRNVWELNASEPDSLEGMPVYAGLDLSQRTDLTAFVMFGVDSDFKKHVYFHFWAPEVGLRDRCQRDRVPYDVWAKQGFLSLTPGATVDYDFVAAEIAEITSGLDVRVIGFDRWRIDEFKKSLDRLGLELPLKEFGQGFKDMSPAIDALEADLLNGRICHGNHPMGIMCASNAVISKDAAGNRKLDKHKATGRIDGLVALAMSVGVSIGEVEEQMDLDGYLNNILVV